MEKIPTAKEFLDKNTNAHSGAKFHKVTSTGYIHISDIIPVMEEFAKLNVESLSKRMYSEEDMKLAFKAGQDYQNFDCQYAFNEWFKNIKK